MYDLFEYLPNDIALRKVRSLNKRAPKASHWSKNSAALSLIVLLFLLG